MTLDVFAMTVVLVYASIVAYILWWRAAKEKSDEEMQRDIKEVDITVQRLRMDLPGRPTEVLGTIHARDFETAMMIIHHPHTLSGNYDLIEKFVEMKEGVEKTGLVSYYARSRDMCFDIRKASNG